MYKPINTQKNLSIDILFLKFTLSGNEQEPRQLGTRESQNLIEESHEPVIIKLNSGE